MKKENLKGIAYLSIARYLNFGIQIIRGIFIAKFLNPYYFGIWGFFSLVQEYLAYMHLGIPYSLNASLSSQSDWNDRSREASNQSFTLLLAISTVIVACSIVAYLLKFDPFPKYEFRDYLPYSGILAGSVLIRQYFLTLHRVLSNFVIISAIETLNAIALLSIVFLAKEKELVTLMVITTTGLNLLGNTVLWLTLPEKPRIMLSLPISKQILSSAFPLLAYNFSFYFMLIFSRSITSWFYDVEQLGFLSFANILATASLLGFNTVAWAFFPKMIFSTRGELSLRDTDENVRKINRIFFSGIVALIICAFLFLPALFHFLPEYRSSRQLLELLLLGQALMAASMGETTAAIARSYYRRLICVSIFASLLSGTICLVAAFFALPLVFQAFAIFLGYGAFTYLALAMGKTLLKRSNSTWSNLYSTIHPAAFFGIIGYALAALLNSNSLRVASALLLILGGWRGIFDCARFIAAKLRDPKPILSSQ